MSVMKKTMLAGFVMIGFGIGVAHADLVGGGAVASDNITFNLASDVINTLTAKSGLLAGNVPNKTILASGKVTSKENAPNEYEVDFTNAKEVGNDNDGAWAYFVGKNDPAHVLPVELVAAKKTTAIKPGVNKGGIIINDDSVSTDYILRMYGNQQVAADTYTLTTVAYEYLE